MFAIILYLFLKYLRIRDSRATGKGLDAAMMNRRLSTVHCDYKSPDTLKSYSLHISVLGKRNAQCKSKYVLNIQQAPMNKFTCYRYRCATHSTSYIQYYSVHGELV